MRPALIAPLLGLPGLAVPVGSHGKLRTGVQIMAMRNREDLCLDAGEVIEAAEGVVKPIDTGVSLACGLSRLALPQESLNGAQPLAAAGGSIETVDAPARERSQAHRFTRPPDRRRRGPPARGCEQSTAARTGAR